MILQVAKRIANIRFNWVGQRSGLRISTVYTLMKFGCN